MSSFNNDLDKDYTCELCDVKFTSYSNMRRHVRSKHNNVASSREYKCDLCDFKSMRKDSLKRHCRNVDHGNLEKKIKLDKPLKKSRKIKEHVFCVFCPSRFDFKKDVVDHYQSSHGICIQTDTMEFQNFAEFESWKSTEEKTQICQFIQSSGSWSNKKGDQFIIFQCHRDGNFRSKSKGQRHMKTSGSNKINGHCPSRLNVIVRENLVAVKYCSTHVGHANELGKLRLTKTERDQLAEKIAMKIPFKNILDSIRSTESDELSRKDLINRKDLHNIAMCYNLNSSAMHHRDDPISVDSWIKEHEKIVRFYKPQSETLLKYPNLKKDDFVLIFAKESQLEMIESFGDGIVTIDSTHGLNSYGIELTTLLLVDDLNEGIPGCFMFSNRVDAELVEVMLETVKDLTRILNPKVFMTDMADSFYNAWVKVMGEPEERLFCSWHVDQAWRKNLPKVKGQQKQAEVYKLLRTLLKEKDRGAFHAMLPKTIEILKNDPETEDYGAYFETKFSKSFSHWAFCYRLNLGLNTNMHIERMHGIIKHLYLDGKKPKRLDIALDAIIKYLDDKLFDKNINFYKGKVSSKLRNLRERHKTALEYKTTDHVIRDPLGDGIFSVFSQKTMKLLYEVKPTNINCNCGIRCKDCDNKCIHEYVCSCRDSSIKSNMCKHIHLVIREILKERQAESNVNDNLLIAETVEVTSYNPKIIFNDLVDKSNVIDVANLKKSLIDKFDSMLRSLTTIESLKMVEKELRSIKTTVLAIENNSK